MNNAPESSTLQPSGIFLWLWLILMLAIAAYIRVHGGNDNYYNPDETMHIGMAEGRDITEVGQFSRYEAHPPFGNFLYHYWLESGGDAPAFARCLPLLFGLLTILLYYRIGTIANGALTGMCCAGLVAFGNGSIIQSYLVRHYALLIFVISCAFYYYLRWRDTRSSRNLVFYVLFAVIACLTNFSAIFDVACIACAEGSIMLYRKAPLKLQARWILANVLIAAPALYVYHLWQPTLVPLASYFATHVGGALISQLTHALFYPLVAPGYILPATYTAALILLLAQVWVGIAPPAFIRSPKRLRFALFLNALADGLGMFLVITRLYPEPGTRHSLWVLPFVILTAGWIAADVLQWIAGKATGLRPYAIYALGAIILLGGMLTYNPESRFGDTSEYIWPRDRWQAFTDYLATLGPTDLIVTEKDDGIMLANLYRYMGTDAFTGEHMAAIAPYRTTHILFNPYYPRNYSRHVLLATLEEAQQRHFFDGIDRIVFLRMAWSRSPLTDLMLCEALQKQLITFPPVPEGHVFKRKDFPFYNASVMVVPMQVFLHDILLPDGKGRVCMDGTHDMAPALQPPGMK